MKLMPVIFFGHGSPMNAIENNKYTKTWSAIIKNIPKPKAIICVSAHWETVGTKITSNKKQKTIHDFYGFPQELYQVQYNPDANQELVKQICNTIFEITPDDSWGLDHGTWSILKHIYQDADIPTLQISIDKTKTSQEHYNLAKKLLFLRNQGVLIIASGNIVHNLKEINWHSNKPYTWAEDFSNTIIDAILNNDHQKIINYKQIQGYQKSVPSTEHFIPLLYILGLQQKNEEVQLFNKSIDLGSIDMSCVKIG
jgi:4,5-DOPA dioxygenase extradiol